MAFVKQRRERIAESKALAAFLQLPPDVQVHPDDVPLVSAPTVALKEPVRFELTRRETQLAIGGSGGGYRAKYGFTAGLSVLKEAGAWDSATWIAGVSGSNWTIAGELPSLSSSPPLEHC